MRLNIHDIKKVGQLVLDCQSYINLIEAMYPGHRYVLT